MKISIIIPSYKETKEQLLETLFSIDTQKRVSFNDVEQRIHDGEMPISYLDEMKSLLEEIKKREAL